MAHERHQPWRAYSLRKRAKGRREALDVADLENDAGPLGMRHEIGGGGAICRQRLLDQDMDPGVDQIARDLVMERRRHGDRGGIDHADQPAVIAISGGAIFCRRGAGA
jgi:hypothetical protein